MMTAADMTGRVALVTGVASGLGRATALRLAGAGAATLLVDIDAAGLDETAARVRALGADTRTHVADLASAPDCPACVDAALACFGRLDALCNVAGVVSFAHTPEMPLAAYQRTIAINLTAPFLLCQAAIPHLLDAEGAIVNVASTAAFVGEAYLAAYCASKAGLVQMTKALAMEYARRPIRINAVAPGGMMTNIGASMVMPEGADLDLVRRFSGLRGTVEVDDVAGVVAHLASAAGRGFHGSCVTIDAGITAG